MAGDDCLFEQGTWVRAWVRVAEQDRVHSEDLVVYVQSHNADVLVDVRRDHVALAEFQPAWAEQCASLKNIGMRSPSEYMRCTRQARHSRDTPHRNGKWEWTTAEQNGNFEGS